MTCFISTLPPAPGAAGPAARGGRGAHPARTEERGPEVRPEVYRANPAQTPLGACRRTGRMTPPPHTSRPLPSLPPPAPGDFAAKRSQLQTLTSSLITGRREKRGALRSPLRPRCPAPLPSPGCPPLCGLDSLPATTLVGSQKEGGGGDRRKRMLERSESGGPKRRRRR